MAEQDDLFVTNKEQQKENPAAAPTGDAGGGGIAEGEVRTVAPPVAKKSSNRWLLLLLLIVLVGGYVLVIMPPATEQNQTSVVVSEPKKQPIPDRQVQLEPLKQEAVAAQPVVAEKPPVVTEKEPVVTEKEPVVAEKEPVVAEKPATPPAEAAVAQVASAAAVTSPVVAALPGGVPVSSAEPVTLQSVMVGPFLSRSELAAAAKQLEKLGFEPQQSKGRGIITMTRLLEGVYPEAAARQRLAQIQTSVGDAFILPSGDKRAIYVGSFSDPQRAANYAETLGKKGIKVALVSTDVEMSGHLLQALEAAPDIARQAADLIGKSGFKTQLVPK